jgi:hypothetical protein
MFDDAYRFPARRADQTRPLSTAPARLRLPFHFIATFHPTVYIADSIPTAFGHTQLKVIICPYRFAS